ncbi:hypothetical protein I547_6976 [Mycobacterium kansasii 824]|uniref:PE family protein n=1 Tax=Mycobacterium kansasii TaxID=1768 RepID=A0A1V3XBJ6_MYCKA|nr:hypothetical protein I547_6976 [Mycobacterium kansasii 824]OOK76585.1 hypothetical protein BZL30_3161 [Mycobacterium kansasii]
MAAVFAGHAQAYQTLSAQASAAATYAAAATGSCSAPAATPAMAETRGCSASLGRRRDKSPGRGCS